MRTLRFFAIIFFFVLSAIPYGGDAVNGDGTIVVLGLRTQVDF